MATDHLLDPIQVDTLVSSELIESLGWLYYDLMISSDMFV